MARPGFSASAGRARVGADLAAARIKAGYTLEEASRRTRIPQRYLEALESGDYSVFPPGPFLAGYTRQYRQFLGLPEAPPPTVPPAEPERTVTAPLRPSRRTWRQAGKLAAIGALAAGCLVLLVRIAEALRAGAEVELGESADQQVVLRPAEPVRARVVADGREVFAGPLPAGASTRFAAHDRLEVELESLEQVTIQYNRRALRPLGTESRPRKLVFVDDTE